MRRIYESNAVHRDDEDPFSPSERADRPSSMRSMNSLALSRVLVPHRLRRFGVSIDVSTPRTEYPQGTAVPFTVTMRNSFPFPVSLSTSSRVVWTWNVDGFQRASHVHDDRVMREGGVFDFDRGERKRFQKRWQQVFQVSDSDWERATPGEYTIGAGISVDDPKGAGLYDETTIRVVEG